MRLTLLDRYFGRSLLQGWLLVLLVLLGLFIFVDFADQLDDVGKGRYGLADVAAYVLLRLPRRLLDLVPFVALLGSSLALGGLATHSELVVMQTAGVSPWQLAGSVLKAGAWLLLAVMLLTEFVAPPLQQYAYEQRAMAISGTATLHTKQGFWSRNGLRFLHIGGLRHGRIPLDLAIYEFDPDGRLLSFIHAASADISQRQRWVLQEVWQKIFDGQAMITQRLPSRLWDTFLTKTQVRLLERPVDSLSPSELYRYIGYLRDSQQQTEQYQLAFWQKLLLPVTCTAMLLLAIPFVLGLPRGTKLSQRLLLGVLIGVGVYLFSQIATQLGLLLRFNPLVTALVPALLALGLAGLFYRRVVV
jgi:lipopolysaccharide export system permease protein